MMAPAHSLTGAAAGLGIASLLDASWQLKLVVVAVCCGAALLPDLDHPGATASRSLWWVTGILSRGVAGASAFTYHHTCGRRDDRTKDGTHRALTHTLPGCVVLGCVVGGITACGVWPATVVLALVAALGVAGIPPVIGRAIKAAGSAVAAVGRAVRRSLGRTPTTVLCALAAVGAVVVVRPLIAPVAAFLTDFAAHLAGHWLLWAVVVTLGCVVHVAGDAITTAGVPALWPLLRDGKRWGRVRLPVLNFDAGSWPERLLITPALIFGCGWLGLVVFT